MKKRMFGILCEWNFLQRRVLEGRMEGWKHESRQMSSIRTSAPLRTFKYYSYFYVGWLTWLSTNGQASITSRSPFLYQTVNCSSSQIQTSKTQTDSFHPILSKHHAPSIKFLKSASKMAVSIIERKERAGHVHIVLTVPKTFPNTFISIPKKLQTFLVA